MIHFIIGTEAELIKVFPLMLELKNRKLKYVFISTGQHNLDKSEILLKFDLKKPDFVLYKGKSFTSVKKMFLWFLKLTLQSNTNYRHFFTNERKSVVLIHGDTISTLLGAVLAKKNGIRVCHLEAGLRSGKLLAPFPEEIVRRIVSKLADFHISHGKWAYNNLKVSESLKIDTKQNTLFDSYNLIKKQFGLKKPNFLPNKYFVFVMHRTENLSNDRVVKMLINSFISWSESVPGILILHHTTKHKLMQLNLLDSLSKRKNILLLERQSYFSFMKILSNAEFVATDGGSNQEECSYMGVPTLLLRTTTERKEGLDHNVVLSNLNSKIIDNFFKTYQKYRTVPLKVKLSPSEMAINSLIEYMEKK